MTFRSIAPLSLLIFACGTEATMPGPLDAASSSDGAVSDAASSGDGAVAGRCAARLVRLSTGPDATCAGGGDHTWPVGLLPTDCHGWRAIDTNGKQHDNSARDIKCNPDGTFSFTQFAGNLDCSAGGVSKVYSLGKCTQDIPPTLYTVAVDLTCCSDPSNPACITATPAVSVAGGEIFLNGVSCN